MAIVRSMQPAGCVGEEEIDGDSDGEINAKVGSEEDVGFGVGGKESVGCGEIVGAAHKGTSQCSHSTLGSVVKHQVSW